MTAPHPSGGGSPLRVGGFVLLGVAAVSAVAGLVSLAGGGAPASQNSAAPAGPVPAASQPAAPPKPAPALPKQAPAPPGPPLVPGAPRPPVSAPAPPPPAAVPPPAPQAPPAPKPAPAQHSPGTTGSLPGAGLPPVDDSVPRSGSGKGVGVPAVKAPLRVYNNSMIKNLAEGAADQFRDSGWTVTSVGNYPFGNIPTSTVYYQSGEQRQREAAEYLASSFGMRAEVRFAGLRDASPGLIVIVTKDFQRR